MFGYVIANVRTLSEDSMREYKKYYCGLCRTLAKRYGFTARFLLSYDTVFLLTVLCALGENKPTCALARCPYHFGKKRVCMTGELADYAADATVLLAYLNFEDDIADDVSLKSRIPAKLYRNAFEKAKAARPELYVKIREKHFVIGRNAQLFKRHRKARRVHGIR